MWNEKFCFPHFRVTPLIFWGLPPKERGNIKTWNFGIGVLQQFGTTWHVAKIVFKNHCTLLLMFMHLFKKFLIILYSFYIFCILSWTLFVWRCYVSDTNFSTNRLLMRQNMIDTPTPGYVLFCPPMIYRNKSIAPVLLRLRRDWFSIEARRPG